MTESNSNPNPTNPTTTPTPSSIEQLDKATTEMLRHLDTSDLDAATARVTKLFVTLLTDIAKAIAVNNTQSWERDECLKGAVVAIGNELDALLIRVKDLEAVTGRMEVRPRQPVH
jgi:hypothetical protein